MDLSFQDKLERQESLLKAQNMVFFKKKGTYYPFELVFNRRSSFVEKVTQVDSLWAGQPGIWTVSTGKPRHSKTVPSKIKSKPII